MTTCVGGREVTLQRPGRGSRSSGRRRFVVPFDAAAPSATWRRDRVRAGGASRLAESSGANPSADPVPLYICRVDCWRCHAQLGRYQGAVADADLAWLAVWWFTPIGRVPLLTSGSGRP